jgi:predicted enzyme related to lactoylglutathione lyase
MADIEILINIDVPELERAIAFYTQAFGLRLARRLFDRTVAELHGASHRIFLVAKPEGSSASAHADQTRDYRRHWTPVHLDFAVADIDLALARAAGAGVHVEAPVQTHAWGRLALLSDPFGNGVCLIEWIGSGYAAVEA